MYDRGRPFLGLHVLVDDDPRWGVDPVEQAQRACSAGAPVVQLRSKLATDTQCLEWARAIRLLTRASGTRFVMNDRYDLAVLADADAVHLGQNDLPPSAIPATVRARLAIGLSTHTRTQLEAARKESLDYIAYGPVFGTTSKDSKFDARGLDGVRMAVELASPRPLIAIGGIQVEHLGDLRRAGVGGFAVISAVAKAREPIDAARDLMRGFAMSES